MDTEDSITISNNKRQTDETEGVTSSPSNPPSPPNPHNSSVSLSQQPSISIVPSTSAATPASNPDPAPTPTVSSASGLTSTYMPSVNTVPQSSNLNSNTGGGENKDKDEDKAGNEGGASTLRDDQVTGGNSLTPSHLPDSVLERRVENPNSEPPSGIESSTQRPYIVESQDGHAPKHPEDQKEVDEGNDGEKNMDLQMEDLPSSEQQPPILFPLTAKPPSHPDVGVAENTDVSVKPTDERQRLQEETETFPASSTDPVPPSSALETEPVNMTVPEAPTGTSSDPSRSLNVNDALGYLDEVKNRFQTKPDVYNHFLEIMKDFKSKRIDTPRVIERVSVLFAGHPELIQGFNTFLPPGYRIECMADRGEGGNMIRVTTPHGTMMQNAGDKSLQHEQAPGTPIQSSTHPPSRLWMVERQDVVKISTELEDNKDTDAIGEKTEVEESQQSNLSAQPPSRLDILSNVDTDDKIKQEQETLHPPQQRTHPHGVAIMSSMTGSASPSPAPPLSSTHLSVPQHSMSASTPGGGSVVVSGLASTLTPTFGTGGSLDPARSLNVNDALGYLDEVKNRFQNNPDVYNHFLEIMKDFKSQRIDTPGVIERVSLLFAGHPALIQGFNTFLPPGYRIECMSDPDGANSMIRVTTPQGTTMQSARGAIAGETSDVPYAHVHGSIAGLPLHVHAAPVHPPVAITSATGATGAAIPAGAHLFAAASATTTGFAPGAHPSELQPTEQALEYVNRIKERYADDPDSYHLFLDLLQNFNRNPEEVLQQIVLLFSQAPDLLEEFKMFLPKDGTESGIGIGDGVGGGHSNLMKMFTQSVEAAQAQLSVQMAQQQAHDGPTKSRRKDRDRGEGFKEDKERLQAQGQELPSGAGSVSPQKRKRRPVEKDVGAAPGTSSKATFGSAAATHGVGGSGPSKPKKLKLQHEAPSPAPYRDHDIGGSPYTNVYQQSHLQTQRTHFHPDAYPQPQFPLPVQTQPHPQYQTQLDSQVLQDTTFFDRVRQFLDNRETYDEFLKLLNLFTQELINLRTLVFQAKSFLGETELMAQFREMVGWEERGGGGGNGGGSNVVGGANNLNGIESGVGQIIKPNKLDLSIRYGPSYRRLPSSETQVVCSGRDAFCNSVLNDEWVSHPSWVSEDSGFIAHKKNIYEEALHRSEEERHEYDFYLEAMSKTISALESPHTKILQMSDADRMNYKLKPNWNGTLKTIHQRLLKKVYGREAGMEVVQAIQDNPAVAIPIVFQRLKQKEEEWKRAQREWNKVWREVDARNYWKSLDHQGVTFKMNDKKNITTKAFVTNIELLRQQQVVKRASLVDATFGRLPPEVSLSTGLASLSSSQQNIITSQSRPRYQLAYTVEDASVLQDAIKLVLSFLDRTHGTIPLYDRRKIEQFIRYFVPLFFMFYQREFDNAFAVAGGGASVGVDLEDVMTDGIGNGFADDEGLGFGFSNGAGPSGSVAGSTRSKNGKRVAGDIRKKVLKATQSQSQSQQSLLQVQLEKSTRRTRSVASASASVSASAPPSAPGSRGPSPPTSGDVEMRDDSPSGTKKLAPSAISAGVSVSHGKLLNNASTGFQPPSGGSRKHISRRGLFFANTSLYVLLRLLNLLYSRLLLCKKLGAELAEAEKAVVGGRQQQNVTTPPTSTFPSVPNILPDTPAFAFAMTTPAFVSVSNVDTHSTPTVGAEHFYGHLLECCERLFDNQIDQATFEDTARYMFGMKAYNIFTVDKVVGAIIKQVQLILTDNKNKELVQLLQKERDNPSMPLQDQNNYREKAGAIVGLDEHLYRINYIPDSRTFTIQLLGKDDSKDEDTLAMVEKWEAYVDAFQADLDPSALPPRGRYPFLRRTLLGDKPTTSDNALFTRNNMETRFCMRTYRMFFVSHTEDILYWRYPRDVFQGHTAIANKRVERRLRWVKSLDKDARKVGLGASEVTAD